MANAAGFGAIDSGSAFAIADDNGDFGVGDTAGGDTVRQGLEVGAATA